MKLWKELGEKHKTVHAYGKQVIDALFDGDYSRAENVQFEDDEYYYYVKAVPKVILSRPKKTVKKINAQRKKKKSH